MANRNYAVEVGERVRIAAWELGYRTHQQIADWLGGTRRQVTAWMLGIALVPVKYATKFSAHGIDLDWIYRGDPSGLTHAAYIRLTAAIAEGRPPPDVAPEPEPEPEPMCSHPRKAEGFSRPHPRKQATAA